MRRWMIIFVVFVWLCGCHEPVERPDPALQDMSHLPPEGDAENNPHHFVPPGGPVKDYQELDNRFSNELESALSKEQERQKVVREQQRLLEVRLELLESRRKDLEKLFATVMVTDQVELTIDSNQFYWITITAVDPADKHNPFKVEIRDSYADVQWKLVTDEQQTTVKKFFESLFFYPDPNRKPR